MYGYIMNTDGIQPARRRTTSRTRHVSLLVSDAAPHSYEQSVLNGRNSFVSDNQNTDAELKKFPLPRYHAPKHPQHIVRRRRRRSLARWMASLSVAIILAIGGYFSWSVYAKLHQVFHGSSVTVAALSSRPVTPDQLNGEGDGRINILLLGIGGPGHDGPDLTDTILVLSIDPVNDSAVMLSVPRDLWVRQPIPYFGAHQKINAVYESGKYNYLGRLDDTNTNSHAVEAGFTNIDRVLKTVIGININYHVLVNFQAFRQAINTVGGITVDVPTPLVDPTMAWENNWNPVLAQAGVQHMDGVKALLYARSRETTSDFARTRRQRQILVALKNKVMSAGTLSNPAKIGGLMSAFGDNIFSDLSTQDAIRLYSIMTKISNNKVQSIGLTGKGHDLVTTDHVGNISVVRPMAGFDDYTAIQAYVRSQLPDGYIVKEHAPIVVLAQSDTGAKATATLLQEYGYNVVSSGIITQRVTTSVVDLSHGKDPFTAHYLQDRYHKVMTKLPAGVHLPAGSAAKFVIMVAK